MSLRINTNIAAMSALRHLEGTNGSLQGTIDRLSSGLRINRASDDPAGLIISEGMRSQINGLNQAIRNSQDAINMAKTAEAALDEAQRLLREIRGIAVMSANTAVVDAAVLQANQTQIRSTLQSLDRIAQHTQFGRKKLLDGTAGAMANVTSVTNVSSIYMGGTFDGAGVVTGPITIDPVTSADRATVALDKTFAAATSLVPTTGSFVINGYSFSTNGTETVQSLVAKINAMSATTGVTAQITGAGPVTVSLLQNTYGDQHSIQYFDPSAILNTTATESDTGTNAVFDVSVTTTSGVRTVQFEGGRGPGESGLKLSDTYGNTVLLSELGNTNITAPAQVGTLTSGSLRFQIGADADQSVQFSMPVTFAKMLGTGAIAGKSIADVDVTTQQGAEDAIRLIDNAVTQLAQMRGELGSFQKNFLESTSRSLEVARENLTATESSIRDANMAEEITNYTRLQILQQSGMSVLAQANQAPQNVLQLLQSR